MEASRRNFASRSLTALAFAALTLGGCSTMNRPSPPGQGDGQSVLPFNGEAAVVVRPDGSLVVVDRSGQPVPTCRLPVGDSQGTCPGTSNTILQKVESISIVHHKGSTCRTFAIAGEIRTLCW